MKWFLVAINLLRWDPLEHDTQEECEAARITIEEAFRREFSFLNAQFKCVSRLDEGPPENWR